MLYNTEAVVVKTVRYGETHLITTLMTPSGLVTAMARSALKPQSRLAAGTRLCAQGIYHLYEGKGMGTMQQVEVTTSRRILHEDLQSAAYAAYFCELLMAVAEPRPRSDGSIYRQFIALLNQLMVRPDDAENLSFAWETKICHWLGVSPDWSLCINCGESLVHPVRYHAIQGGFVCGRCTVDESHRQAAFAVPDKAPKILHLLERTPIEKIGNWNISEGTKQALQKTLYYQLTEFGGLYVKSRTVLQQMKDFFGEREGTT